MRCVFTGTGWMDESISALTELLLVLLANGLVPVFGFAFASGIAAECFFDGFGCSFATAALEAFRFNSGVTEW